MTPRKLAEKYPSILVDGTYWMESVFDRGEGITVDLSLFIAAHGLDAELPGISGDDPVTPTTMTNEVWRREP